MSRPLRGPEHYLRGFDGPVVEVPARCAAWLERAARMSDLRLSVRGLDPELDAVLTALAMAAAEWRKRRGVGSVPGTELEKQADGETESALSTADAAELLEMSDRGVRKAISDGRLPAQRLGDVWLIARFDLEQFRATREVPE